MEDKLGYPTDDNSNNDKKPVNMDEIKKKFNLKEVRKVNLGGKVMFLVLDTNNIGTLYFGKIEDGFFSKGDKSWFVGAQQPILVKSTFGYTPMYILRYDSPFPTENVHAISPEFLRDIPDEERNKIPTPTLLNRLLKMVILSNVIKPKRKISVNVGKIILLFAIAAIIYYVVIMKGGM